MYKYKHHEREDSSSRDRVFSCPLLSSLCFPACLAHFPSISDVLTLWKWSPRLNQTIDKPSLCVLVSCYLRLTGFWLSIHLRLPVYSVVQSPIFYVLKKNLLTIACKALKLHLLPFLSAGLCVWPSSRLFLRVNDLRNVNLIKTFILICNMVRV